MKPFIKKQFEAWTYLLSLMVSLKICEYLYIHSSTLLTNFYDRGIGHATIRGIDPGLRVELYLKLMFSFIALFCAIIMGLSIFCRFLSKRIRPLYITVDKSIIFLLSAFAIFSTLMSLITRLQFYQTAFWILTYLIGLYLIKIILKAISFQRQKHVFKLLQSESIFYIGLIFPWVFIFSYFVFFNKAIVISPFFFVLHGVLVIIFYALYGWGKQILSAQAQESPLVRFDSSLIFAAIPFSLIPISIPLSNEFQFTLSSLIPISPRLISILIITGLALFTGFIFVIRLKAPPRCTHRKMINLHFIILGMTLIFYAQHQQFFDPGPELDFLHLSEWLSATHQLFQYLKIPFIDLWQGHGLRDCFPTLVYSLINGWRGLESMIVVNLIPSLICLILIYCFLKILISPLFAILCITILPIRYLFGDAYGYYLLALLPGIYLLRLIEKPNFRRFSIYWLISIFCFLWYTLVGLIAWVAPLLILPLYSVNTKQKIWKKALGSFGIIFGAVFLICALVFLIRKESLFEVFQNIIGFFKTEPLIWAYDKITSTLSPLAYFQYFFLPIIGVSCLLISLLRTFQNFKLHKNHYMLGFIAVCGLTTFIRSLNRHCLLEGPQFYYFIFLACSFLFLFPKIKKEYAQLGFLTIAFIFMMAFPTHLRPDLANMTDKKELFSFQPWKNKENRVVRASDAQYKNLKKFMDQYLSPQQSFIAIAGSPLLYILLEREMMGNFFAIDSFYGMDSLQNRYLKKLDRLYQDNKIPIALKLENWWGSHIDGIPREVANYRIMEFIHSRYFPGAIINDKIRYQIWIAKNYEDHFKQTVAKSLQLPFLKNPTSNDVNNMPSEKNLRFRCGSSDPYVYRFLDLTPMRELPGAQYLRIQYKSSLEGDLQVFYQYENANFNEKDSIRIKVYQSLRHFIKVEVPFEPSKKGKRIIDIRLDPPNNSIFELIRVDLIEMRLPLRLILEPYQNIVQNFHLLQLPSIWGTYDPQKASSRTPILQILAQNFHRIRPKEVLPYKIDPTLDRTTGNYLHIRMKASQKGTMFIKLGTPGNAGFSFDILPGVKMKDYLVRLSMVWHWWSYPVEKIFISADIPLEIEKILIRKGD